MDNNYTAIGNPVDSWWTSTRNLIDNYLDLLANYPPAPDSQSAREMLNGVNHACELIEQSDYPRQAKRIREYLLESLNFLSDSLKEQAALGVHARNYSHNMAYHSYMMVAHLLLKRGIYEPCPKTMTTRTG